MRLKALYISIKTEQTTYSIKTKQTKKPATSKNKKKAGDGQVKGQGPNIK